MDGIETYTVRFYETERYDVQLDRDAIQFMATTPTWWSLCRAAVPSALKQLLPLWCPPAVTSWF